MRSIETSVKCACCGVGDMRPGTTTFTVDREGTTFVLRNVPAEICDVCGEVVFDLDTARTVECLHKDALESRAQVVIREFTTV